MKRLCLILLLATCVAACRGSYSEKPPIHIVPNMDDEERFDPQEANAFFADGRAMRQPVAGTVARNELKEDTVFYQGRDANGELVKNNPLPIDEALLRRGQERFNIFCAQCHDRTGSGHGLVVSIPQSQRIPGFPPPPSYHEQRLRDAYDGHFFDAITNGIRTMPSYASQIPTRDRWAIIAYIRALQRSQNAPRDDVPRDILTSLENR